MQVTINIPDFAPLALNSDLQELKKTIKLNSALMLYKKGKLSLEQASDFANLSIYEFLQECKNNQIAVLSASEEELKEELELLAKI